MHTATSGALNPPLFPSAPSNPYESDRMLHEYLLFHYGTASEVLPFEFGPASALDYPVRCVRECVDSADLGEGARALDLGCAVGRSSFELARVCGEVVGIDFSRRFIDAAEWLRSTGSLAYQRRDEGDLTTPLVASMPGGVDAARVRFEQGDAQALRADLGQFDVVLMANLIDRLNDPQRCLAQLPGLVKLGGQLVITSPYTWMEEYTPRNNWLGGHERGGAPQPTLDGLHSVLSGHFNLSRTLDLPFLIREHARKYQWSVAQASLWRRR